MHAHDETAHHPQFDFDNQIPTKKPDQIFVLAIPKTPEQIEEKRIEFNDPKWRPAPLAVVNVSSKIFRPVLNSLIATEKCRI